MHPLCLSRRFVQVIGCKVGLLPKMMRARHADHIALTTCGPGWSDIALFPGTFSGTLEEKYICEGTPRSRWQRTTDG